MCYENRAKKTKRLITRINSSCKIQFRRKRSLRKTKKKNKHVNHYRSTLKRHRRQIC